MQILYGWALCGEGTQVANRTINNIDPLQRFFVQSKGAAKSTTRVDKGHTCIYVIVSHYAKEAHCRFRSSGHLFVSIATTRDDFATNIDGPHIHICIRWSNNINGLFVCAIKGAARTVIVRFLFVYGFWLNRFGN